MKTPKCPVCDGLTSVDSFVAGTDDLGSPFSYFFLACDVCSFQFSDCFGAPEWLIGTYRDIYREVPDDTKEIPDREQFETMPSGCVSLFMGSCPVCADPLDFCFRGIICDCGFSYGSNGEYDTAIDFCADRDMGSVSRKLRRQKQRERRAIKTKVAAA